MFAGEQQWDRAGHKQELCRPGFCAQHCTGVSRHLVIWCCEYKPSIETFFHFKAPRGFSGHWLNGSRGRGAQGEQVQSISGVIPTAICFLFRGPGSLNALWHASWRHTPLAAAAACPVTMAPWFRLTLAHVPSQPWGSASFVIEQRVGDRGGGGGGRWRAAQISV